MSERIAPSQALKNLGIELPEVAKPLASYTPAAWALGIPPQQGQTGLVRTSGQLPTRAGQLLFSGRVGEGEAAQVSPAQAARCAQLAALNALAAAAQVAGGIDRLLAAVTMTVYVNSVAGFQGQAAVANGASELLGKVFAQPGVDPQGRAYPTRHTRSAVGVAQLPLAAPVELEVSFLAR